MDRRIARRTAGVLLAVSSIAPFVMQPRALASSTITLRSSATAATASGGATSLNISKPSGVASGDLLVAGIVVAGGTLVTITAPSGWTLIRRDDSTVSLGQGLYYKIAGGSEPSSYTWSFSLSENASGGIAAYTGTDPTTPIQTSSGQASTLNGTTITAPTLTTAVTNEMLVGFFATGTNQGVTPPSDLSERWDLASGTVVQAEMADGSQASAAASGAKSATVAASAAWAAGLVALRPACGGSTLTLTAPSTVAFGSVTLTGADQTVSTTGTFTPSDTTASGSGWNITGTSTTFSTGGGRTLPTTATTITAASAATTTGNCSLPTNTITYPLTLPAGATAPTAVKIYNASAGTGLGASTVTPTFRLSIPSNAYVGSYSSTWTFTIASGP